MKQQYFIVLILIFINCKSNLKEVQNASSTPSAALNYKEIVKIIEGPDTWENDYSYISFKNGEVNLTFWGDPPLYGKAKYKIDGTKINVSLISLSYKESTFPDKKFTCEYQFRDHDYLPEKSIECCFEKKKCKKPIVHYDMKSHKPKGRLINLHGHSVQTDDHEKYQTTKDVYFRSKPVIDRNTVIRYDKLVPEDCINPVGADLPPEDYIRIPKESHVLLIGHTLEKEIISGKEGNWFYVRLFPSCPGGYPTTSVEGWIFSEYLEKLKK
ncbi:hypothetical protein LEP1GSC163_1387 [Leptospira santarosai str. CBC379]|uniref:Uncharacterized protein n=1 Tax=Leptospira santarosai str. MOR084 TaxID=1049984 RepID=A0A0E2BM59_9LEPT|nr:hypothetical protein [Leptospira santarosai]EKO32370.1 hypothetical protein LEP1GSC179_0855 [Leptospira santarosai str. MOR084]EKR91024.1 hypothetical protein LEP1GSC163_1387 [Leptospira santarosai str. CBC379]